MIDGRKVQVSGAYLENEKQISSQAGKNLGTNTNRTIMQNADKDFGGDVGAATAAWLAGGEGGDGDGGRGYPGPGGTVIPPDLFGIRGFLGDWLMEQLKKPPTPYNGSLDVGLDPMLTQAAGLFGQGLEKTEGDLDRASMDLNPLRGMASNPNYTDITAALDAIRKQGQGQLEDTLAGIREKYSAYGLGQGSDVTEGLARGGGRVIADMTAQQQQLVTQIMESGKARQLSAAQALPGASTGIAQARTQAYGTAGAGLSTIGQVSQTTRENNLARNYAEFVRLQQPNPLANTAVGYATGFPPVKPIIPENGNNNWLMGILGMAGAALPGLIGLSDRNLKEDIQPVEAVDILQASADLPIFRWKYKGMPTPHIGPMAQDFQKNYGVGDGTTINLIDVMGVLLASNKAIAEKVVGRGRTAGAAKHA
jgi:hypothetical protein